MPLITQVIPRRRQTWIELVADNGESVRLPLDRLPAQFVAGSVVDPADWQQLQATAEYCALREHALRILTRREHFRRELELKLGRGCRDRDLIRRVLADCAELGYLNDRRAAQLTVQTLLARGGIGQTRLRQELARRGCPPELIAAALREQGAELDEAAEITRLLEARKPALAARLERTRVRLERKHQDRRLVERQLRQQLAVAVQSLLAGRGFTGDQARQAARELVTELLEQSAD